MLKAPCKDCPDRYLGCHDHCDKYKAFDVERKAIQEQRFKQRQTDYDYFKIRQHHHRKDYDK